MLKKIAAILTFAVAALMPVAPAAAWDEVCVHFPLWKTAFAGDFAVVYDYDFRGTGLPSHFPSRRYSPSGGNLPITTPHHLINYKSKPATVATISGTFGAGKTRCVTIGKIRNGQDFTVFVRTTLGTVAHCSTHSSNPNKWYTQQQRPFRKIWWQSWGVVGSPTCQYWRETN